MTRYSTTGCDPDSSGAIADALQSEFPRHEPPLSPRDLFAAHAMAGIVASIGSHAAPRHSAQAYVIADAMLAERFRNGGVS